jgi:hypothetical protein
MNDETRTEYGPDATKGVEQRLSEGMERTHRKISDSLDPAKAKVGSFVERQKSLGAEQVGGIAGAVHSAARELEPQAPGVAKAIHDAAGKLEGVSTSLRDKDAGEVLDAIGRFARSQPLAFFGGAVLTGFAVSRFLKSSADRSGRRAPGRQQ